MPPELVPEPLVPEPVVLLSTAPEPLVPAPVEPVPSLVPRPAEPELLVPAPVEPVPPLDPEPLRLRVAELEFPVVPASVAEEPELLLMSPELPVDPEAEPDPAEPPVPAASSMRSLLTDAFTSLF